MSDKASRQRRQIAVDNGLGGFEAMRAHEVDLRAEMIADELVLDVRQLRGPDREKEQRVRVSVERGPWWSPWSCSLRVEVEA